MLVKNTQNTPAPLVTMTLFGYRFVERFWAFAQMGFSPAKPRRVDGLRFWKLFGSRLNPLPWPLPNWSRYGLSMIMP